jgi:hypothetical protein
MGYSKNYIKPWLNGTKESFNRAGRAPIEGQAKHDEKNKIFAEASY